MAMKLFSGLFGRRPRADAGTPVNPPAGPSPRFRGPSSEPVSLSGWTPPLRSPDAGYLPQRDRTVARIREMAAENGYLSGAVQRAVDEAIGANIMLNWRPDLDALGLPKEWGAEWIGKIERRFRNVCDDPRCPLDAGGQLNLSGLLGLAFRSRIADGESLAVVHWLEDRPGPCHTAIQVISPDRLSNPMGKMDDRFLRAGVERDDYGRAIAYHIQDQHPTDPWNRGSLVWHRIEARTGWGRPRILFYFEPTGPDQTRGRGFIAPALEKLKLGDVYERTELEAAVINAIFAAFVETPFDKTLMDEILEDSTGFAGYQEQRSAFAEAYPILLNGARISRLFPGETMNLSSAGRANAAFPVFMEQVLRHAAAAMGQSYEQFSGDWSKTNYSSARAALLQSWKFLVARRTLFASGFATPLFGLWLEEELASGRIDLPEGTPDFWEAPAAWQRCQWIGPGRGWVDPVKEAQAAAVRMEGGLSTLQDEAAEQGRHWEDILDQRAREIDELKKRGLDLKATAYEDVERYSAADEAAQDARPAPGGGLLE